MNGIKDSLKKAFIIGLLITFSHGVNAKQVCCPSGTVAYAGECCTSEMVNTYSETNKKCFCFKNPNDEKCGCQSGYKKCPSQDFCVSESSTCCPGDEYTGTGRYAERQCYTCEYDNEYQFNYWDSVWISEDKDCCESKGKKWCPAENTYGGLCVEMTECCSSDKPIPNGNEYCYKCDGNGKWVVNTENYKWCNGRCVTKDSCCSDNDCEDHVEEYAYRSYCQVCQESGNYSNYCHNISSGYDSGEFLGNASETAACCAKLGGRQCQADEYGDKACVFSNQTCCSYGDENDCCRDEYPTFYGNDSPDDGICYECNKQTHLWVPREGYEYCTIRNECRYVPDFACLKNTSPLIKENNCGTFYYAGDKLFACKTDGNIKFLDDEGWEEIMDAPTKINYYDG